MDAASEPKVKIPGLPVLSGSVPSKSSMVETAPSVGIGLLFRMLTVVVVRGPIPVPDGVALASETVNDLVGAFSGLGRATRWIVCVVWPGATWLRGQHKGGRRSGYCAAPRYCRT